MGNKEIAVGSGTTKWQKIKTDKNRKRKGRKEGGKHAKSNKKRSRR